MGDEGRVIVTWNVQRLSMREHNRRRLSRVVEKIVMKGWEIVLLSEISSNVVVAGRGRGKSGGGTCEEVGCGFER